MRIEVRGTPGPQGSKKYVGNGVMVESSAKVKPWREAVKWAAIEALPHAGFMFHGPLHVEMHFTLVKPKSCPKKRKYPDRTPDLDKLLRSTNDALTQSGIWEDDSRVVRIISTKNFPGVDENTLPCPGVVILIEHAPAVHLIQGEKVSHIASTKKAIEKVICDNFVGDGSAK